MDLKRLKYLDKIFVAALIFLIIFGLVVLVSATSVFSNSSSLIIKQIGVIILGFGAAAFLIYYDYLHIKRFSTIFYLLTIILLILVIFLGDNKRWLDLGILPAIQVAEITKILLILS